MKDVKLLRPTRALQAENCMSSHLRYRVIEPKGLPVYKDLHLNWDRAVEEEDCGSEDYEDEHHNFRAYNDYRDIRNSPTNSPRRSSVALLVLEKKRHQRAYDMLESKPRDTSRRP